MRNFIDALNEAMSDHANAASVMHTSMTEMTKELRSTQNLSKKNNNSILIKAGLVLIAFPDPTISDVLGTGLVAAGLIHTKIKHSGLHIEDVYKTFPQLIKDLGSIRQGL